MANVCENNFYAYGSEETIAFISEFLKEHFDADVDCQVDELFAYFDSRWTFPEEMMEELFNSISDKEELYMRCLSVEYGCMYHSLWYCDEDGWHES